MAEKLTGAMQRVARRLTGTVVSTKMNKTITVNIRRSFPHHVYGKTVHRDKKFLAHDENEASKEGDRVVIEPCRPLSRTKHYFLHEILPRKSGEESVICDRLKPLDTRPPYDPLVRRAEIEARAAAKREAKKESAAPTTE